MNHINTLSFIEHIHSLLGTTLTTQKGLHDSPEIDASVLVPLACYQNELAILFTHRSEKLYRHRGQVSFPGGIRELQDCNLLDTALRETKEEIGIQPEQIRILGSLLPVTSTKNFRILPYVGFIESLNGLRPDGEEVARIFCVPYNWLSNNENIKLIDYIDQKGRRHKVWSYSEFEGETIWGITANILHTFVTLVNRKN